jgi:hypothetical protein
MSNTAYILMLTNKEGFRTPITVYSDIALARNAKEKALRQLVDTGCRVSIHVVDVDLEEFDVRDYL